MYIHVLMSVCLSAVLDVAAFERLMGPAMDICISTCWCLSVCLSAVLNVAAFGRLMGPAMDICISTCWCLSVCLSAVLDVAAFERLMGPAMDIMYIHVLVSVCLSVCSIGRGGV